MFAIPLSTHSTMVAIPLSKHENKKICVTIAKVRNNAVEMPNSALKVSNDAVEVLFDALLFERKMKI